MLEKRALTQVRIADLIARRWSGRAFDPARPVSQEQLIALLEAARWAPSCYGDQPWRYLIWDRIRDPHNWARAFECLSEGNQSWAKNAPILMLACANSIFTWNQQPNRWGQYDTGGATMNLCLQATELGLMVHQMGGFDADKIRKEFEIPAQYSCMAMIAVGYQLPKDRIPEELRQREYAARVRRPLGENFFLSTWGNPITLLW